MKIILKNTPPSLNRFAGRENVWEYREQKRYWSTMVLVAALSCDDRPKSPYAKARVEIRYFFQRAGRHDADNYCGKLLLDGLTRAGVIADDDFAHISLSVSGQVDRKNPRTEITITQEDE